MLALLLHLTVSRVYLDANEERNFIQWMRDNNQFYTGNEYHIRLGIFISNYRYIQNFNLRSGLTFRLGLNKFSCHTPSEYNSLLGTRTVSTKYPQNSKQSLLKKFAPESCDWREKGVVSPIKDQGACGSCWAFSAIATSESAYAITTGQLLQFSEQNLIDCGAGDGCSGGWPEDACNYVIEKQGGQFNSENDYPYRALPGDDCLFDESKKIGKITSIIKVEIADEDDLKEKVGNYGVAAIVIAANNIPFQMYSGGILDDEDCAGTYLSHAVNAVGYGAENGIDYWIVRNSWGPDWGEDGYVRMIRNKHNLCGVATRCIVAIDSE